MRLLPAALLACALPVFATGYRLQRGVVYAVHDGTTLRGDLYRPAAPGPHPALLAVHGGGWFTGDASFYAHLGPYLASRGYVLFAVDYRLADEQHKAYPEAVQDLRAALQFLRGRGAALGVDPARLGLIGDSAGAHLAALLALAGDDAAFAQGHPRDPYATLSVRVKACAAIYGIYDVAAQWARDRSRNRELNISEAFLGAAPDAKPQLYSEASPLRYATAERRGPAFLLAWGDADEVVEPDTQSEPFARALELSGFTVQRAVISGAAHGWATEPLRPGSPAARLAPKLLAFLKEQL